MKKIVIMGASSGIGLELARRYAGAGWTVGACGRRLERLESLAKEFPGQIVASAIDINTLEAVAELKELDRQLGGMDVYLHVSGIGYDNPTEDPEREVEIVETNCAGFARMIYAAFGLLKPGGRLAAVTSVAGSKGMAGMEAYSASKKFDRAYLQALRQHSQEEKREVSVTDLRPGWTRTALLRPVKRYPLLLDADKVAAAMIKAIEKRRVVKTIDWRWALLCAAWQTLPDWIWRRMSTKKFR